MNKAKVFLSHITEEKDLAFEIKKMIEDAYLGMIEVFVSSDPNTLRSGSKWLNKVGEALSTCSVELILCSKRSVKRPWINFEAGAGWIREIPVIPLCHTDMKINELPVPLSELQAVSLNDPESLKSIFPVLSDALNSRTPSIDFEEFTKNVKKIEEKYAVGSKLKNFFDLLNKGKDKRDIWDFLKKCSSLSNDAVLNLGAIRNEDYYSFKRELTEGCKRYVELKSDNPEVAFNPNGLAENMVTVQVYCHNITEILRLAGVEK